MSCQVWRGAVAEDDLPYGNFTPRFHSEETRFTSDKLMPWSPVSVGSSLGGFADKTRLKDTVMHKSRNP